MLLLKSFQGRTPRKKGINKIAILSYCSSQRKQLFDKFALDEQFDTAKKLFIKKFFKVFSFSISLIKLAKVGNL